jgi:oligopeptide/dipeptide ABC transporter ATP-binding protein
MDLIRISGLRVAFSTRSEEIRAVDEVDLAIRNGDTISLIGESGCGKTVMGMAIMGLLPRNAIISGTISYGDQDLVSACNRTMQQIRGKEIAMIYQNSANALNPVKTVGDQIAEPLLIHHILPRAEAWREAIRMLSALGFEEPERAAGQYPHEFSGGMRERILIAMALICNPQLIIADEPTSGLDAEMKSQIQRLIKKQITGNSSLFLITHDLGTASFLSKRIVVMYAGEIVETGPTKDVLAMPRHPYTQGLLASLPSAGLHPIPGMSPAPSQLPDGCRFCARCPAATNRCRAIHPLLKAVSSSRKVRCLHDD